MTDLVDDTLRAWRRSVFGYGSADCLLSVGDYIAARTGNRRVDSFRGSYDDAAGAMALIEAHGGPQGLIDLCGLPRILPKSAGRGDVVVFDTGTGKPDSMIAGLCTGEGIAARMVDRVIEVDRRFMNVIFAWTFD